MKNTKSELFQSRKIAARKIFFSTLGPFGTAIEESLYGIGERIRERRIQKFIEDLEPRLKRIESFNLSKDYLKSEEFYNLISASIDSVINASNKHKIKIVTNIFEASLNPKYKWEEDIKNIFFEIINEFSINHFLVFQFLTTKQNQFKIKSYNLLHDEFLEFVNKREIEIYQFRLYCRDIANKSLIRFSSNILEIDSTGGLIENEDSSKIPSIKLTSLGQNFIKILV